MTVSVKYHVVSYADDGTEMSSGLGYISIMFDPDYGDTAALVHERAERLTARKFTGMLFITTSFKLGDVAHEREYETYRAPRD